MQKPQRNKPMDEFRVKYDRLADVLYISTERNGPAYAREGADGIIWRYLETDDTLVGATIMDFDCYWRAHLTNLIAQVANQFRVPAKEAKTVLDLVHS